MKSMILIIACIAMLLFAVGCNHSESVHAQDASIFIKTKEVKKKDSGFQLFEKVWMKTFDF